MQSSINFIHTTKNMKELPDCLITFFPPPGLRITVRISMWMVVACSFAVVMMIQASTSPKPLQAFHYCLPAWMSNFIHVKTYIT